MQDLCNNCFVCNFNEKVPNGVLLTINKSLVKYTLRNNDVIVDEAFLYRHVCDVIVGDTFYKMQTRAHKLGI